jgi:hypothetical protein
MKPSTWGVLIQYSRGGYNPFIMGDDSIYESLKIEFARVGVDFIAGKKGIPDSDIDSVCEGLKEIVRRLNNKEPVDVKSELERFVSNPDMPQFV